MEYCQGNIFVREMRFGAVGTPEAIVLGHGHNFDHTTYIVRGSVKIEKLDAVDNVIGEVVKKASDGFNFVLIKAGVKHRLTALEDNSMGHCIYAHRNPQGEVVQEYDGWTPGYV